MARKINIPVLEYSCMPIGELLDLADIFKIYNGAAEEIGAENEASKEYIPNLR